MYPYLFHSKYLPSYSILMVVGVIVALVTFKFLCKKKKVDAFCGDIFFKIGLLSILGGMISARLFQMMYNLIKTGNVGEGITFMGGFVGGAATFFALFFFVYKMQNAERRSLLKNDLKIVVNVAIPCVAVGHCLGRIGCFLAGCCYGKPTDAWFGVNFVEGISKKTGEWIYFGYDRMPTQLFEALFLLVIFVTTLVLVLKKDSFAPLLVYAYGYSIFRFILEFFRDDESRAVVGVLSPSQWHSILMFLCAVVVTIVIININSAKYRLMDKNPTQVSGNTDSEAISESFFED